MGWMDGGPTDWLPEGLFTNDLKTSWLPANWEVTKIIVIDGWFFSQFLSTWTTTLFSGSIRSTRLSSLFMLFGTNTHDNVYQVDASLTYSKLSLWLGLLVSASGCRTRHFVGQAVKVVAQMFIGPKLFAKFRIGCYNHPSCEHWGKPAQ